MAVTLASLSSPFAPTPLDRHRWQTRDELRLAIVIWIRKTYHRRRRQDTLGRMTPLEYGAINQAAHAA